MKCRSAVPALFLALALTATSVAQAGSILQPAAASTSMGTFGGSPDAVRNQSGLSAGYTSLATDFDAYIASTPTHASDAIANTWISSLFNPTGNFDFDLGGTFTIESLALWNLGGNNSSALVGFNLLADDNAAFSSPTVIGSFSANPNTGPADAVVAEVFGFAPTSAAYVRFQITSNNSGTPVTGFGEAAFEVSAVPEPSTFVLLCLGAAGIGWRRRVAGTFPCAVRRREG